MKKLLIVLLFTLLVQLVYAGNLTIGGYGQIDYNQKIDNEIYNNGILDVHRMVFLFGYQFDSKTKFISEIEYEHVKEVYVEQAYLAHKLNNFITIDAGLMLIPMGIINLYHEPPTFNGVERPTVDKYIAPTTWREIGAGISGNFLDLDLKYKLYLVNGFNGYDGSAKLSGKNGLRKGRQKGAESYMSSPNLTGRVEYYGLPSTTVGFSGYFGNTQSTLYDGLEKNDDTGVQAADSSVIGVSMVGLDFQTKKQGFEFTGQFYHSTLSNTNQYNRFTSSDVGKSMIGYYIEGGYDVLRHFNAETQLISFIRYEKYNTQNSLEKGYTENNTYNNQIITLGLSWKVVNGAVFKCDYQLLKSVAAEDFDKAFNAGVGIMF